MSKKQLYSRLVSSLVEMSVRQQKNNAKGRGRKSKRNQRKNTTNPAEVGPQQADPTDDTEVQAAKAKTKVKPDPTLVQRAKATGGIARATHRAGAAGSIMSRMANKYADSLPAKSHSSDDIRNFTRGVTKLGAGATSAIKGVLKRGKNVPLGGKSLV
jgi:hypothetical protein